MADNRVIHWVSGVALTSGAVQGVVCQWDLSALAQSPIAEAPNNCALSVEAWLSGYVASGTLAGHSVTRSMARAFRRVSGTLSVVGGVAVDLLPLQVSDAGLATVLSDLSVQSPVLRLVATGVAAQDIRWFGDMRVRLNQPA